MSTISDDQVNALYDEILCVGKHRHAKVPIDPKAIIRRHMEEAIRAKEAGAAVNTQNRTNPMTDERALRYLRLFNNDPNVSEALDYIAARLAESGAGAAEGYRPAEIGDRVAMLIPGTIEGGEITPMRAFAKAGHEPVVASAPEAPHEG